MYDKFKQDIETKANLYPKMQTRLIEQSYLNAIDVMIDFINKPRNIVGVDTYYNGFEEAMKIQYLELQEQRKLIENHD